MRDHRKFLLLQPPGESIYLSKSGNTGNLLPFILLVISCLLLHWTSTQKMTHLATIETLDFTQVLLLLALNLCCKFYVIIESLLLRMNILVSQLFPNEVVPHPIPVWQLLFEMIPFMKGFESSVNPFKVILTISPSDTVTPMATSSSLT